MTRLIFCTKYLLLIAFFTLLTPSIASADNVNVRDPKYGAKGDGVTDDSAAFAKAYQAAGIAGQVFVPAGNYLLLNPPTLNSATLYGAGPTSVLVPRTPLPFLGGSTVYSLSVNGGGIAAQGSNNTIFEAISLNVQNTQGPAISVSSPYIALVLSCRMSNCRGGAIVFDGNQPGNSAVLTVCQALYNAIDNCGSDAQHPAVLATRFGTTGGQYANVVFVDSNTISNSPSDAIRFQGNPVRAGGVPLTALALFDNITRTAATAINVRDALGNVSFNQIRSAGLSGISLRPDAGSLIGYNRMQDCGLNAPGQNPDNAVVEVAANSFAATCNVLNNNYSGSTRNLSWFVLNNSPGINSGNTTSTMLPSKP